MINAKHKKLSKLFPFNSKISETSKKKKKEKNLSKSNSFKGERGFTYPFGYKESDAYIQVGDRTYISVFDVLIKYGTNNPAKVGWLLDTLPKERVASGQVVFIQRQKQMDKKTQNEIVEKRLTSNIQTITNTRTNSSKQEVQNLTRIDDMRLSQILSGEEDQIIDSDLRLIVRAKTSKDVEEVIEELKYIYKNYDTKGVMFVRRTGEQLQELENLTTDVSSDAWHNSDMSSVSAGRLFLPSSGFSDSEGTYVGDDIRSLLTDNPAIIDFTGIKNAVIFMGGVVPFVSLDGREGGGLTVNGGSAVAHVIAESGTYLGEGGRTHHIMLSEFDYRAPDSLSFDMSKEAINPLEVFGKEETVQQDANANFNKAVIMMLLTSKLYYEKESTLLRLELNSLLVDWFIKRAGGQGLYTNDPLREPMRANRILATEDHDTYPMPMQFLTELQANVARRSNEGESQRNRASILYEALKTTFTTYSNIFNKPTTLPDVFKAEDRNIYYDLSKISDDKDITGSVFLNVLAYVTNRTLDGEQIVIHGLDQINIPSETLEDYKERIVRKNIGLITVFEKSESEINPKTFSSFVGRLSRQDMVVLGGLTEDELNYINESWRESLPKTVADQLRAAHNGILYFHRSRDRVGALVDTHLIL